MPSLSEFDIEFERNKQELKDAYKQGFIDGMTCFAWWKDGVEYLGTSGTKLKDAIAVAETQWNYNPDRRR